MTLNIIRAINHGFTKPLLFPETLAQPVLQFYHSLRIVAQDDHKMYTFSIAILGIFLDKIFWQHLQPIQSEHCVYNK